MILKAYFQQKIQFNFQPLNQQKVSLFSILVSKVAGFYNIFIVMLKYLRSSYPQAQSINQNSSSLDVYKFLNFAPSSDLRKLNMVQVDFLLKQGFMMPRLNSTGRRSEMATHLLKKRKEEILKDEQMRRNGVEPMPEEKSTFSKFVGTVMSFFKPSYKKNFESLLGDDIDTSLNQTQSV